MSVDKKALFCINAKPKDDGDDGDEAAFFINIISTFEEDKNLTIFGKMADRFRPFIGLELELTENIVIHLEKLALEARKLLTEMEKQKCRE